MAHYDIFRGRLAIKYPAYGHALWEPSPPRLSCPVEIGDVGFIRLGRFHRLFNALLSADHPSHESGVPEYHEPLTPNLSEHIVRDILDPSHYCSAGIDVATGPDFYASGYLRYLCSVFLYQHFLSPDDHSPASFSCQSRQGGAILSLPVPAQRQDTLALDVFGRWMVKHIDRWFAFARHLELGIEQMEEIVLITGCDRAKSWTNVAFLESQADAQVSFGVKVTQDRIDWQLSPEEIQGVVLNQGPVGEVSKLHHFQAYRLKTAFAFSHIYKNLPENQCIFLRGFRVVRAFGISPKHLRAAAEPKPSTDADEYDSGTDREPVLMPSVPKVNFFQ